LISFVVPFFNEDKCVEALYVRIRKTCEALKMDFELICIDDCGSDATLRILRRLRKEDPRVKFVSFSRNFGHQVAIMAGLHRASGDCVVVMDGDLQDPPEIVVEMVNKWRQGFDVVYGIRTSRKEGVFKGICYKLFYRILHKISLLHIPLDVGDFGLMSRRVVLEIRKLNEENPFVRGIRAWVGFKQTGIEYCRVQRADGASKYTIRKLFRLAFDGLLSFSTLPLEAATLIGLAVSLLSITYGMYIGVKRILLALNIIGPENVIPGWATLVCSVMFLIGLQFIFLGILGKYIGRIFIQVKNRPPYVVQEESGFEDDT
jgi:dolichol-phosphate mannosyltransferase